MIEMLAEMFSYNFIIRAFIVGMLVSLCASLLGVTLVLKRYSMIGDGLSHVGFGALAIAASLNLAPLEGGDEPIRRLDTQVVNLVKEMLNKINSENYAIMADLITKTLAGVTGGGGDVGENRY